MTGPSDWVARQNAVISAACSWSGAIKGRQAYPASPGVAELVAECEQQLLAAVAAYLEGVDR